MGTATPAEPHPTTEASPVADDSSWVDRLTAPQLLLFLTAEFVILLVLLLARPAHWLWIDRAPAVVGGVFPLIVPWAGALGALTKATIGLSAYWGKRTTGTPNAGPAERESDWNAWYLTRVPLGAVQGSVAAMIVLLFTRSIDLGGGTATASAATAVTINPVGATMLMIISFAVGYKQQTFNTFFSRLLAVVLGSDADSKSSSGDRKPTRATLDFGSVTVRGVSDLQVAVTNAGSQPLAADDVGQIDQAGRAAFEIVRPPDEPPLAPNTQRYLTIRFRPAAAQQYSGNLYPTTAHGSAPVASLTGTGVSESADPAAPKWAAGND